ncbi:Flp pilus assembly protein CpaB [Rhodobacterales bacterium HKCCE3408]|nr:Flp pilus assembly protein CpaB [Rhodobacterales bacterium HKCCE3408]
MRLGSIFMTIVGLGIAGGAVYVADVQIERTEDAGVVQVMVASRDIPFGAPIESHMLTVINWPAEAVPAGAFSDLQDLLPPEGEEPRRATSPLSQGDLVLMSRVSDFGEKVTIVQTLAEDGRAMAIEVDAGTGVGGFVTPGDFVDVVLTQGRDAELRAVTVLQNIRVIGVDQASDERLDQPGVARTVTLEVTARQGQVLALAQQAGRLSLSLRSLQSADADFEELEPVRLSDIIYEPVDPEIEEVVTSTIVVRRGVEVETFEQN